MLCRFFIYIPWNTCRQELAGMDLTRWSHSDFPVSHGETYSVGHHPTALQGPGRYQTRPSVLHELEIF